MFKHILIFALIMQPVIACKFTAEENKASHTSDSEAKKRELLEKIMLDYLQRLKQARINYVVDPKHDQGELQVKVRDAQIFGSKTFTQVSWEAVQADKIEVLRCALDANSNRTCANVREMEFTKLEESPSTCGYTECKRVLEKIFSDEPTNLGTRLIDHSIMAASSTASYQYLVRPCFENYLLLGQGESETLVKCGDDAIKNSNSGASNSRYLAQRACGESDLLICGKSYLSSQYIKNGAIIYIDTDLFDKREEKIKQLEELAMKMARAAQQGLTEHTLSKDMTYDERMNAAMTLMADEQTEKQAEMLACIEDQRKKSEEEMNKSFWQRSIFWQALAAAPFRLITEAPDCHQAENAAEGNYINKTTERAGEGAVSDAGRQKARDQGYTYCALDNIGRLSEYYHEMKESGETLSSLDASRVLDIGIAMIPLPSSELNSRSTSNAVLESLIHLTSPDRIDCDCIKCLKIRSNLYRFNLQREQLVNELFHIKEFIQVELTNKGIEDPYAAD